MKRSASNPGKHQSKEIELWRIVSKWTRERATRVPGRLPKQGSKTGRERKPIAKHVLPHLRPKRAGRRSPKARPRRDPPVKQLIRGLEKLLSPRCLLLRRKHLQRRKKSPHLLPTMKRLPAMNKPRSRSRIRPPTRKKRNHPVIPTMSPILIPVRTRNRRKTPRKTSESDDLGPVSSHLRFCSPRFRLIDDESAGS